jgi:hypothetical protein
MIVLYKTQQNVTVYFLNGHIIPIVRRLRRFSQIILKNFLKSNIFSEIFVFLRSRNTRNNEIHENYLKKTFVFFVSFRVFRVEKIKTVESGEWRVSQAIYKYSRLKSACGTLHYQLSTTLTPLAGLRSKNKKFH